MVDFYPHIYAHYYILITFLLSDFVKTLHIQNEDYSGIRCLKFMRQGHPCPYPGQCLLNSTCVLWGEGSFSRTFHSTSTFNDHLSNCTSFDDGKFINGHWHSKCNFEWLSPIQMRYALIGKRFSFYGDSLVRQTFLRLVSHIRGFHTSIDVFFHTNAFYVFNATNDYFGIPNTYRSMGFDVLQSPLFILDFYWNTETLKWDSNDSSVSLRFFGIHYWVHDYLFDRCNKEWLKAALDNTSVFCTTPDSKNRTYTKRNTWIKNYTNYLPLQEMAETKVFLKNFEDDTHFQCGFLQRYSITTGLLEYKAPANGDCRDWMNLNLVMMLVHMSQIRLQPKISVVSNNFTRNDCIINRIVSNPHELRFAK